MTTASGVSWTAVGGVATLVALILTGIGTWIATKTWTTTQADRLNNEKKNSYDAGYATAKNVFELRAVDAERRATEAERRAEFHEKRYLDLLERRGGTHD